MNVDPIILHPKQHDMDIEKNTSLMKIKFKQTEETVTQAPQLTNVNGTSYMESFAEVNRNSVANFTELVKEQAKLTHEKQQKIIDILISEGKLKEAQEYMLQSVPAEVMYLTNKRLSDTIVNNSEKFLESMSNVNKALLETIDTYNKSFTILLDLRERQMIQAESNYRTKLALIKQKNLQALEQTRGEQELERENKQKLNEIDANANSKKWDLEEKRLDKEVDILKRKYSIENDDIKAEFQNQLKLYEQQLADARKEIQANINKYEYHLNYDPPKIIIENGKKMVKPGTVSYRIHREKSCIVM